MRYSPCPLWLDPPADAAARLPEAVARGIDRAGGRARVWFRADDIAQPGALFSDMLRAFEERGLPLALAVTPAWLPPRAAKLVERVDVRPELWTLHMHGYRHVNHEPVGRKLGFGPSRSRVSKRRDLEAGVALLRRFLGDRARLLFTPPWNRCDAETMEILRDLGFAGVSRTPGAKPPTPPGLADLPVSVDLHTRKEPSPEKSLDDLLREIENGLATGCCGVMLHHQRANAASRMFLDALLDEVRSRVGKGLEAAAMHELPAAGPTTD